MSRPFRNLFYRERKKNVLPVDCARIDFSTLNISQVLALYNDRQKQ